MDNYDKSVQLILSLETAKFNALKSLDYDTYFKLRDIIDTQINNLFDSYVKV